MLNKEIPFFRIGLLLCFGIISGLYFKPDTTFLVVSSIIVAAGFLTSLFFNRKQVNIVYGISFTYAIYLCGIEFYTFEKKRLSVLEQETSILSCTISEYPDEREKSYRFVAELNQKININEASNLHGSILIYFNKIDTISNLIPGDKILIKCSPKNIANRGNPNEFDYRFFMENRGIRYFTFITNEDIIKHIAPQNRKLIHRASIIRNRIIEMYKERGLNRDRLALIAAITLGQKNMLEPEQRQNFIKAGVMHIMAVSGLHTMIVSLFVYNILFFLKNKLKALRVIITILLLWFFAFITGLTPSVLRATLMFSFLHTGNLINRHVNHINSVLASAIVLILIRPSVIFEAGFLLSYSAVIFIICFFRDLYLKLHFKKWLADKIWQAAVVTFIAQAGTLPLTIALFNRFPVYFIFTNILIVPLTSLVVITACLVPITYPVALISFPLVFLLGHLAGITEFLTCRVSSLPFSTIENIGMTTIEFILLSCTLFLLAWFLLKRGSMSVRYPLFFLTLFVLAGTIKEINNRFTRELIVYNSINFSSVGIRTGKILTLYEAPDTLVPEVLRHCATLNLKLHKDNNGNDLHNLKVGNKHILISNYLNNSLLQKTQPDIVILRGRFPQVDRETDFIRSVEAIVMTSEVSSGYQLPLKISMEKSGIIYYVSKSGAFRKRI